MTKQLLLYIIFIFHLKSGFSQAGQLDSSFGNAGIIKNDSAIYFAVAIQNGKIIAGGTSNNNFTLDRYNSDGSLDSSFLQNGLRIGAFTGYINSIAIQQDGKIVAAGNVNDDYYDFALARYNINGTLDSTFSTDGYELYKIGDTYSYFSSVAIQGDGKIVATGSVYNGNNNDFALVRFNADGSLDNAFGNNGKQTTGFGEIDAEISSIAIQPDNKIVAGGYTGDYVNNYFALARYNSNGSPDTSFGNKGKQTTDFGFLANGYSLAVQPDGKIVLAGQVFKPTYEFGLARYTTNGTLDNTFGTDGKVTTNFGTDAEASSVVIQNDGKIIVGGSVKKSNRSFENFALARYNVDGTLDSSFSDDGKQITDDVPESGDIFGIAISKNKLYAVGTRRAKEEPISNLIGTVAAYLLNNQSTSPTVTLTTPANNATYHAPAAHIKLSATASDADGSITKVEFYNRKTLLHAEYVTPYGFVWRNVPVGNYILTAKAYDNSGLSTTSTPIHISVVANNPPTVSIIKPKNNQPFAAPGYIHFEADAKDVDGRITRVEFYNGSTLLNTQYQYPYTFVWKDVPVGTYTITAVATDNGGAHDTANVIVRVLSPIVSNRPSSVNDGTSINEPVTVKLIPNPATNVLNIYANGLQQNKPLNVLVSASGAVIKKMQFNSSTKVVRLDILSLLSGVYTVKVVCEHEAIYRSFVKL